MTYLSNNPQNPIPTTNMVPAIIKRTFALFGFDLSIVAPIMISIKGVNQ